MIRSNFLLLMQNYCTELCNGRLDIKILMPTFYVDSKNDLPREIMGFRIIQKINSLAVARELIFCIILNPIISLGR